MPPFGGQRRVQRVQHIIAQHAAARCNLADRLADERSARRRSKGASTLSAAGMPPAACRSTTVRRLAGANLAISGVWQPQAVEGVRRDIGAGLDGNGRQMQHGVGRASERQAHAHGVLQAGLAPASAPACTPSRTRSTTRRPLARHSSARAGSSAGIVRAAGQRQAQRLDDAFIVLAVPMKAHAPGPPQARHSIS